MEVRVTTGDRGRNRVGHGWPSSQLTTRLAIATDIGTVSCGHHRKPWPWAQLSTASLCLFWPVFLVVVGLATGWGLDIDNHVSRVAKFT